MKRIHTTILALAMIVASLGFIACGGGDNDGADDGTDVSEVVFAITIDGKTTGYDQAFLDHMNLLGTWEGTTMLIGTNVGDFRIKFPSGTDFSSLKKGYSSFHTDAEKVSIGISTPRPCTYASGSAKVISNDGKTMKVSFSGYTFTWNTSRKIIFDGTLNIVLLN